MSFRSFKKIRAKIKIIMPAEIFVCPLKISVGIHFGGHVCPLKNQNWPEKILSEIFINLFYFRNLMIFCRLCAKEMVTGKIKLHFSRQHKQLTEDDVK